MGITADGNIRQQRLDVGTVAPGSVDFSPALIDSYFCPNPNASKYNGGNQENIGNVSTSNRTGSRRRSGKTTRRPKSATATSTKKNSKINKKDSAAFGTFILESAHTK